MISIKRVLELESREQFFFCVNTHARLLVKYQSWSDLHYLFGRRGFRGKRGHLMSQVLLYHLGLAGRTSTNGTTLMSSICSLPLRRLYLDWFISTLLVKATVTFPSQKPICHRFTRACSLIKYSIASCLPSHTLPLNLPSCSPFSSSLSYSNHPFLFSFLCIPSPLLPSWAPLSQPLSFPFHSLSLLHLSFSL